MGAVTVRTADTRKQLPIATWEITPANPLKLAGKSDSSGFFKSSSARTSRKAESSILKFRHPDYRPLALDEIATTNLRRLFSDPVIEERRNIPAGRRGRGEYPVRYSMKR